MKPNRVAITVLVILLIPVLPQAILPANGHTAHGKAAPGVRVAQQESKPQNVVAPETAASSDLADLESRADLQMARKEYAEAAKTYKQLVVQAPKNPVYLNKLGIAYHQQTMLSVAQRFYEKAAKADPQYADALNNIGTIYYQRKFQRAVQLDPAVFDHSSRTGSVLQDRSLVGERGMFNFLLAKSYAQMGDAERCAHYLRKARDEGYSSMAKVKDDPAFAAVLRDPGVQEALQAEAEKNP